MYLCDFQQLFTKEFKSVLSCELLSKFVSLWLPTTLIYANMQIIQLWITFKICIFVISNNTTLAGLLFLHVVNYFQNLYLCDLKQPKQINAGSGWRCELLSKFVSLWLRTTVRFISYLSYRLWITFKICIFVIENNLRYGCYQFGYVVNYFQNLYLCDWEQHPQG